MRTPKSPVAALLLSLFVGAPLLAQSWRGSAALEVQADDPKGRGVDGAQVTLVFLGAAERPSP
ncbi:MAG TPA: hypothetical protein VLA66_04915, partial [Thermoanaerobaculia bacterium]|nr:hypothetical protein [Thermoanaerobaculia bacterium]